MKAKEEQDARKSLAIYFIVLIAGSAFLELRILHTGKPIDQIPFLLSDLMYVPAAASLVARLCLREGFRDVSFRLGGREAKLAFGLALVYPIVVGFLSYGAAWAVGLADFRQPVPLRSHLYVNSAVPNLLASLLISSTLGTAVSCLLTFGEELGWRGYMLTRLVVAGVPKPVFTSGAIWAVWHVPLILSGQYASGAQPWLSAILFVIGVIAHAYLTAYLRFRRVASGQLWSCMPPGTPLFRARLTAPP